jgi:acetolactate synthase small subunit
MLVQVLDYQADESIEEEWIVVHQQSSQEIYDEKTKELTDRIDINNIEFIPINEISYISLPLAFNPSVELSNFVK